MLTIQTGQTLAVLNSDATLHNIHGLPKKNAEFNFGQPRAGMKKVMVFMKAEIFRVKCDVHPWMACYIQVFDHPFFAVTGKDGTFEITGLPNGTYTIEAWHETFGTRTATVAVTGDTIVQDFTFEAKQRAES